MESKDRIDALGKKTDVIHKKILILLSGVAGSWIYGLKFSNTENNLTSIFGILLFMIFIIFSLGLIVNYLELNKINILIDKELEDGKD